MVDADHSRFTLALGLVATALRAEADTPVLNAYWHGLADLPSGPMFAVLSEGLRRWDRFPSPAEIRRFVREVIRDQEQRAVPTRIAAQGKKFLKDAFLLAQLADPDLPVWKKDKIRDDWRRSHEAEKPPWEEGERANG